MTTDVPVLTCSRCGNEFERPPDWTDEESPELLCGECRGEPPSKRRRQRRRLTVECASCGAKARISFEPKEGRPVYCKKCYKKQQSASTDEEEELRIPSSVDLYMRSNRWAKWVRSARRNGSHHGFPRGMAWEGPVERPPLPRRGLGSAGTYD